MSHIAPECADVWMCVVDGGGCRVLACGQAGNVVVWDRRASKRQPCSTMQAPRALGPLHCLELSGDNQVRKKKKKKKKKN